MEDLSKKIPTNPGTETRYHKLKYERISFTNRELRVWGLFEGVCWSFLRIWHLLATIGYHFQREGSSCTTWQATRIYIRNESSVSLSFENEGVQPGKSQVYQAKSRGLDIMGVKHAKLSPHQKSGRRLIWYVGWWIKTSSLFPEKWGMDQSPVSCRNPHLIGTTFPNVGNVEATDRRHVRVAHGSEGA